MIVLAGTLLACGFTRASAGITVLLGDKECKQALKLADQTKATVLVQLKQADAATAARQAASQAGLLGKRIFVAQGDLSRIHLADNIADVVIAPAGMEKARTEILRVLRPGGKGTIGSTELTKQPPKGMDDWSHPYHGPDNNPQSNDRLARAPFLTQFIALPRYAPAPQVAVSSGGRLFMAFGHVAWHEREEESIDTLIALNGYNGTQLWKRKLPAGIMVDRCTMIATPKTLYLADDKSCKLIDATNGKVTSEIVPPQKLTGGTFWKWMALQDGVLYALVGSAETPDKQARWRKQRHGWPWGGISQGYNQPKYTWGFGRTLVAMNPVTKKVLWSHTENKPIDSRGICMKGKRIFIARFGEYLAALNVATGKPLWRRTADADADLFKAIGPYRPGHGYVGGWKSTVYLKCTDKGVYFIGPQVNHLTAISADEGKLMWTYRAKDLHVVIRDDGLYTIGPQSSGGNQHTLRLDPMTGKVLARYNVSRRACTRSTGSADGIFFRAHGGSVRLDLAAGKPQWISPMRPSCHVGVLIANGLTYWVPWTCDCNLQMFGVISCGPAGKFKFDRKAGSDRLEKGSGDIEKVAEFNSSIMDWRTYRADNKRMGGTAVKIPSKVSRSWSLSLKSEELTAPTAGGGLVFLADAAGVVRALDADTGKTRWTAYTGGQVRYPPTIAGGRVFVGSGDGWAYAFEAATGRLLWRFRGAPVERMIPVYGKLQSTWPAAAGVAVRSGVAYFAAGMNNFDGTHIYALDAASGKVKWRNNSSGHIDSFSRRGVGVQGGMLLEGNKLYLAGGNAVSPGVYNTATGDCLTFAPPPGSRGPRGRELSVTAGGQIKVSGQPLYSKPSAPVYDRSTQWSNAMVKAPNATLSFVQGDGGWSLVARDKSSLKQLWSQPLPQAPVRWGVAVDSAGRIFVTLRTGRVVALAGTK
jgi:outer membrane protein assembly factor BamB